MPFTPDQKKQPQQSSGFVPDAPISPGMTMPPEFGSDTFKAAVHSQMLGIDPGMAYSGRQQIDTELRSQGGDYDAPPDDSVMNDIKVGLQGSIFGLHHREKLPDEIDNPTMVDKFITGTTQTIADLPWMIAGGLAGGAAGGAAGSEAPVIGNITGAGLGAAAGAFGIPSAMREALVQGIKKGDVKGFGDLMHRAAAVTWAGAKGAAVGAVTELAGSIPVGSLIAKSSAASIVTKGLYQATAMTTAGDLLDGHIPNAKDFAGNAALVVPLNLLTHGVTMNFGDAHEAQMDRYVQDGTHPEKQTAQLNAQPPVKPDLAPGLRPAIQFGEGHIEGDTTDSHETLAERSLAKKPVTMEQLEADPTKADDVLEQPKIHDQEVIDRAWQIKKEAVDAGEVDTEPTEGQASTKVTNISELYNRGEMKSGRGFVTPDGEFLTRKAAKGWMRDNEPDVHDMWLNENGDDKTAELHTEAYAQARTRTQNLDMAKGDPTIDNVSPENLNRLAAAREGLNKIKAGNESAGYGNEVLRTLFAGQRDTRVAATTQVRDSITKLIPDYRDQEALSILRDYKGTPDKLAADLAEIQAGDSERMKALIPSIERAMNPSPELLQADQKLTDYYTGALDEGRQFGFLDSTIDPSHYSPHLLTRILEGEQPKGSSGKAVMSQNTPFAQERSYPTVIDALKTGRIDARTLNAVDALSVYGDRHATVVATKILATELKNTDLGKYGTTDNHPDGWVELAPGQSAFRNKGGDLLYVPKDVAVAMKPLFESGLKGTPLSPLLAAQGYVKALELGLSLFHMKALSVTALNNMGLVDFTKSLTSDIKSPEFAEAERGWAADGLTTSKTGTPYEAYKGLDKSSIPTGLDRLADVPVIKQVDVLFKATTRETFDVIQRKFKVEDASRKGASWLANHTDATNEQYFAARRSIAKEVNSAYGGLNWDVLGTGKTVRDVSRLFLLAPDWTFSNVLTAKYSFEGGPAGSAARMFWAKSFATGFAMTAAASIAIGGKYDPTDIKHIDQVYLGTDKDGKEMYADWFFAGAPRDAITLVKRVASDSPIAGTAQFIVGKASPLLGAGFGLAANKQGSGAPIYNRTDDTVDQTIAQGKYAAGRVVPITGVSAVKTVTDALTDPEHEYSYSDLLSLAADALGSPTIHEGSGESGNIKRRTNTRASGGGRRFAIR